MMNKIFPISYIYEDNDYTLVQDDGDNISITYLCFLLNMSAQYLISKFNIEYNGFGHYFANEEEDIKKLVRYINTLAILKKV